MLVDPTRQSRLAAMAARLRERMGPEILAGLRDQRRGNELTGRPSEPMVCLS